MTAENIYSLFVLQLLTGNIDFLEYKIDDDQCVVKDTDCDGIRNPEKFISLCIKLKKIIKEVEKSNRLVYLSYRFTLYFN